MTFELFVHRIKDTKLRLPLLRNGYITRIYDISHGMNVFAFADTALFISHKAIKVLINFCSVSFLHHVVVGNLFSLLNRINKSMCVCVWPGCMSRVYGYAAVIHI